MLTLISLLLAGVLVASVDFVVWRSSAPGQAVTYQFVLRNQSARRLHNFMLGTVLSDSCPELRELPVGGSKTANCPGSIVVPKPWIGSINFQEECDGYFLEFDYDPETFDGLGPGDSLRFAVTVAKPDSSFGHASFWITNDEQPYVGSVRLLQAHASRGRRRTTGDAPPR